MVKSVSVKCGDPEKPGANMTSYVYGANETTNTPSVAFSNQTTLLNGASPMGGMDLRVSGALSVVLAVVALAAHVL